MQACERYVDLKRVRQDFKCSGGWLYANLSRHLELQRRKRLYPWPTRVGIDEHFFRRGKHGGRDFVSVIVDQKNHRLMELVEGRTRGELEAAVSGYPRSRERLLGRHRHVRSLQSFAKGFFPNRRSSPTSSTPSPPNPAINRHRRAIMGDVRTNPIRRLLLRNGRDLDHAKCVALHTWLAQHPSLRDLYNAKEAVSGFYRGRSATQATRIFTAVTPTSRRPPSPSSRPSVTPSRLATRGARLLADACNQRHDRRLHQLPPPASKRVCLMNDEF
jgi:transposase